MCIRRKNKKAQRLRCKRIIRKYTNLNSDKNQKNNMRFFPRFITAVVCAMTVVLVTGVFWQKDGMDDVETEIFKSVNTEDIENIITDTATVQTVVKEEESMQEVENIQEEVLLRELSWEEFENGKGEVIFHFSFTDGTVVDKEVEYGSIVEGVAYQDITGDGTDEIIAFLYYVNTAAECTVIKIYQVDDGTVRDISPQTQMEELAGKDYNMKIVEDFTEEYSFVLHMEHYSKDAGITYVEVDTTVGYKDGGWEKLAYLLKGIGIDYDNR